MFPKYCTQHFDVVEQKKMVVSNEIYDISYKALKYFVIFIITVGGSVVSG